MATSSDIPPPVPVATERPVFAIRPLLLDFSNELSCESSDDNKPLDAAAKEKVTLDLTVDNSDLPDSPFTPTDQQVIQNLLVKVARLDKAYTHLQEQHFSLRASQQIAFKALRATSIDLSITSRDLVAVKGEYDNATEAIDLLKKDIKEMKRKHTELSSRQEETSQKLEESLANVTSLKNEVDVLKQQLEKYKDAKDRFESYERRLWMRDEEFKELQAKFRNLYNKLVDAKNQCEWMEHRLDEAEEISKRAESKYPNLILPPRKNCTNCKKLKDMRTIQVMSVLDSCKRKGVMDADDAAKIASIMQLSYK